MRRSTAVAVLSVIAVVASSASLAAGCNDILEKGIRNTYSLESAKDVRSEFETEFCSSESSGSSSSASGTLGVGAYKVGYGSQKGKTEASSSCDKARQRMSDEGYLRLMQENVDSKIVDAWKTCKDTGVLIDAVRNGKVLTVIYKFLPVVNVTQTIVTEEPQISGANCPAKSLVGRGSEIKVGGIGYQCDVANEPISIVLNTRAGVGTFFAPAPLLPSTKAAQSAPPLREAKHDEWRLNVTTGTDRTAGTDGRITATLSDNAGHKFERVLDRKKRDDFERGKSGTYQFGTDMVFDAFRCLSLQLGEPMTETKGISHYDDWELKSVVVFRNNMLIAKFPDIGASRWLGDGVPGDLMGRGLSAEFCVKQ